MAVVGSEGDTAEAQPHINRLQTVWTTIYTQVNDLYNSRQEKVEKIKIDQKNSYHISDTDDNSKSIILPTYSADKLCEITFRQFTRSCVKITMDKRNRKITRLFVTSTFNSKIGWSNFDRSIHKKGNEDSEHFLAIYQRHRITGPWFILSIQVANQPFFYEI